MAKIAAKVGTLQMIQYHIGMFPPLVWLNSQAPWDAGGLIICLHRAQWIHHHHSTRTFLDGQGSSSSFQPHSSGTVRISSAKPGESSLFSASSSLRRTRESIYMMKLQHIALDDQRKSGGNLGPD